MGSRLKTAQQALLRGHLPRTALQGEARTKLPASRLRRVPALPAALTKEFLKLYFNQQDGGFPHQVRVAQLHPH